MVGWGGEYEGLVVKGFRMRMGGVLVPIRASLKAGGRAGNPAPRVGETQI